VGSWCVSGIVIAWFGIVLGCSSWFWIDSGWFWVVLGWFLGFWVVLARDFGWLWGGFKEILGGFEWFWVSLEWFWWWTWGASRLVLGWFWNGSGLFQGGSAVVLGCPGWFWGGYEGSCLFWWF
jgi:hypothetical protein